MVDTVRGWLDLVEALYPAADAAEWDHVGLQVGDPAWPVERVLITLDVTSAVVDEAADGPPTLILAHHPLLMRPLRALTPDSAPGKIALAAACARVAVAAAHTNLDVAADGAGTSDPVSELLELEDVRPLTTEVRDESIVKLVTFVPSEHTDDVLDALSAAGAGGIGNYERASFRVAGAGTFRPLPGADPYSGTVGKDHVEAEDRFEMEVPKHALGAVLRALQDRHPYEEVAYDVYPRLRATGRGFGRIGSLPQPLTLRAVAARIRDHLPAPHLRFAGNPERTIRMVAIVGGGGDSLLEAAVGGGADVYVTGDLRHHATLDGMERGIALIDAGHHATEQAALPAFAQRVGAAATAQGLEAQLIRSATPTVPWSG